MRDVLFADADDAVLDIDAETGILLRAAARLGDEEFRSLTILDVTLGVAAGVASEPQPGPPAAGMRRVLPVLTLAQAAERAPFVVFRPRRAPAGAHLTVECDEVPGRGLVHVNLGVATPDGRRGVWIRQRPAGDHCDEDLERWERVSSGGRTYHCWTVRQPWTSGSEEVVLIDLEGTRVSVRSSLPRDLLIEMAVSLEPRSRP
jgi:hypothetical protein